MLTFVDITAGKKLENQTKNTNNDKLNRLSVSLSIANKELKSQIERNKEMETELKKARKTLHDNNLL